MQLSAGAAAGSPRRRSFRLTPLKCRDLAATLELDISWDLVNQSPPPSLTSPSTNPSMLLHHANGSATLAGLPPSSTLLSHQQHQLKAGGAPPTHHSISSRRTTTASMSSQGSEADELHSNHGGHASCGNCRAAKRRLERKELQIVQLESFLKESQKRIDALAVENDELAVRESAETANAGKYRALSLRLVQELEVAFQFCANQMANGASGRSDAFMFVPQFEFMERVKKFHAELLKIYGTADEDLADLHDEEDDLSKVRGVNDPVNMAFDFLKEVDAAVTRNERLRDQLSFLQRSMRSDSAADKKPVNKPKRTPTTTSSRSEEDPADDDSDTQEPSGVKTMTEQLNNLERENFRLRGQLQEAQADLDAYRQHPMNVGSSRVSEASEAATIATDTSAMVMGRRSSASSATIDDSALNNSGNSGNKAAFDLDRIREDEDRQALNDELAAARKQIENLQQQLQASVAAANEPAADDSLNASSASGGFLNKIYLDVGKAKVALEEKVKQLNQHLMDATEENARLRCEVEKHDSNTQNDAEEIRAALAEREEQLDEMRRQVDSSNERVRELEELVRAVKRELRDAQDAASHLETELAGARTLNNNSMASPSSFVSQSSLASSFVAPSSGADDSAVADLQKQLKLARQEVMQLRYRSNQLESASEKLEEMSKDKRALQAKLTALEGQLYEQRSRDHPVVDDSASHNKVRELEHLVDTRDAQLQVMRQELEQVKSMGVARSDVPTGDADLDAVLQRVREFENEIAALAARNDKQAARIEKLTDRVAEASRERKELEDVLGELVVELERVEKSYGPMESSGDVRAGRTPSIAEESESDESVIPVRSTGRVIDRYASAISTRSASNSTASIGAPVSPARGARSRQASGSVTSSRIAALMKNFSEEGGGGGAAPVKKPVKLDFRSRNASTASSVDRFNR